MPYAERDGLRLYYERVRRRRGSAWNGVAALMMCDVPLLILLSAPDESTDPARLARLMIERFLA